MMTMFQYVKIESHKKRFVCLEQSVATFAWILFLKEMFCDLFLGEYRLDFLLELQETGY